MRRFGSLLGLVVLVSSAGLGLSGCDDDGGEVTAEEFAALCAQVEAKNANCTEPSVITLDCGGVPAGCRSKVAAYAECLVPPAVDTCGDAGGQVCQTQFGAALQCALSYCQSHPTDPGCAE